MNVRNASISIAISEDALSATISECHPAEDSSSHITSAELSDALRKAGVIAPPLVGVLTKINAALNRKEDPCGIVVARGTPPEPAKNASIKPAGDLRLPVFPGDVVGTIIPAQNAVPGKGVDGSVISAPGAQQGEDVRFAEDSYCSIDTNALQIRASRYGIITLKNNHLHMRPLFSVSPDLMVVMGSIFAKDYKGNNITAERISNALKAEDITQPLEANVFLAAVTSAAKTGAEVPNVPLCRGIHPQNGKDGWFELFIQDERSSVGVEAADGSIDFRARGMIKSVSSNTKLGKLHAPKKGKPGKDVFGRLLPSHDGAVFRLQLGENVEALEGSEFASTIEGMVIFKANCLAVSEIFQTRGDLDMSVGNIELERGSAHIRGAVLSGFRVSAPRHVRVDDIVENAEITCGGDIEVNGGIIMDQTGFINATGNISATFAKGAKLTSQADIIIAHELSNCTVFARNNVEVIKGRGRIMGSTVQAGGSILANELGSDLGVPTTITLGLEAEKQSPQRTARRKELKALIDRINTGLGGQDPKALLERTPAEKRPAVAAILKTRIAAQQELAEIEREIEKEKEFEKKLPQPKLKVFKTIHPGTTIKYGKLSMQITETTTYSQIFYNPDTGEIVIASL